MSPTPTIALNNGQQMPQLGFGVFQVPEDQAQREVETALENGSRSFDTAAIYGNETGVGRALAATGVPREEVFVTTKLWIDHLGRDAARRGLEESLERLALDRVDLFLLHWPAPATDAYLEAWQGLEDAVEAGLTSGIGVSNFLPEHLERLQKLGGTLPAVNQIELHPALQNRETVAANARLGVATEAWSPLAQGAVLQEPAILEAAAAHDVSPAQAVLRWHLQRGNIVIPKSVTPTRIAENFAIFGFELSDAEVAAIDALERDGRTGPHPADFNG